MGPLAARPLRIARTRQRHTAALLLRPTRPAHHLARQRPFLKRARTRRSGSPAAPAPPTGTRRRTRYLSRRVHTRFLGTPDETNRPPTRLHRASSKRRQQQQQLTTTTTTGTHHLPSVVGDVTLLADGTTAAAAKTNRTKAVTADDDDGYVLRNVIFAALRAFRTGGGERTGRLKTKKRNKT